MKNWIKDFYHEYPWITWLISAIITFVFCNYLWIVVAKAYTPSLLFITGMLGLTFFIWAINILDGI